MFCSYRISTDKLSRGPSAIAEPLVSVGFVVLVLTVLSGNADSVCSNFTSPRLDMRGKVLPLAHLAYQLAATYLEQLNLILECTVYLRLSRIIAM